MDDHTHVVHVSPEPRIRNPYTGFVYGCETETLARSRSVLYFLHEFSFSTYHGPPDHTATIRQ